MIIISSCIFLLLLAVGALAQSDTLGWEVRNTGEIIDYYGITHKDNNTAWAVGEGGTIVSTTDGGLNWTKEDSGVNDALNDITYLDDVLFAGGENGILLRNLGNDNWEDISPSGLTDDITAITITTAPDVNTANVYFVTDQGQVYHSQDSGTTWNSTNTGTTLSLNDIDFYNETFGLIVGDQGTMLGTLDGGETWDSRDLPAAVDGLSLYGVAFDSSVRAYAVGESGLFLRSSIGDNPVIGFVWEIWETNTDFTLFDVDTSSVNRVWSLGQNGTILLTKDGGNSFSKQPIDESVGMNTLYQISIVDGEHGYAVGESGTMLFTDKGGVPPSETIGVKNYDDPRVYLEEAFPVLLEGFWGMVRIIFFSMLLGFALGITFAMFKTSEVRFFNIIGTTYTDFFRNTPLLVQILLIHFGLAEIGIDLTFGGNFQRAVISSILSLGINSGAYQAEIIRSGILAIPSGQMEAGRSLGLNYLDTMRYVILPQAIRIVIPPLGNEFVNLTLNSSLASLTGLYELVRGGRIIVATTFKVFQTWVLVALFYFVVTYSLTNLLRYAEKKTKIPGLGLGER